MFYVIKCKSWYEAAGGIVWRKGNGEHYFKEEIERDDGVGKKKMDIGGNRGLPQGARLNRLF